MPVKHIRVAVTHGLGSQAGMLGFCHPLADGRLFAGIRPDETRLLYGENGDILREIGNRGELRSLWRKSALILVFHSNIRPNMPLF